MKKALNKVMGKLHKHPISSLSAEELRTYFAHRLENVLSVKRVLVRNELEYLLTETGPGQLRFDPEILSSLAEEKFFIYSGYDRDPQIKELLYQKKGIEKYILDNSNSPQTRRLLANVLENHLEDLQVVSTDPFIVEGVFSGIPVACLIRNNGWIFPNTELFSYLRYYQKEKRFPIIISKKISGILFPVFKYLFILGVNTYKIHLPKEARQIIDVATSREPFYSDLKYHNQFQFISKSSPSHTMEDNGQSDTIDNFFENTMKNNIARYYTKNNQLKIEIQDNYIDTVSQFRKSKASKGLIKNYQARVKLIQDLLPS